MSGILFGTPGSQSPAAYSNANLQGAQLAARIAGAASAAVRGNMRTALEDSAYLYKIHPAETAAGLTEADLTFGFKPYNVLRYGADPTGVASCIPAFTTAYDVAMATTPHGYIYAPAGTYSIPSPGLNWTNQKDIYFKGDGFGATVLKGDNANAYTILKISADTGHGTTGLNLVIGDFSVLSGNVANQHSLWLADYLYAQISNLQLMSAGNALTMQGMAQFTCTNVYALTWESNTNANFGLKLYPDTDGIGNDGLFNGCWFQGSGNATGAVYSLGTFSTLFNACTAICNGANLNAVVEHTTNDDVTWIEPYSEESYGAVDNSGAMFIIENVLNFRLIGGTINTGNAANTIRMAKGLISTGTGNVEIRGTQFNNFQTCAISYNTPAAFWLTVENVYASGGAEKVIDPAIGGVSPTGIFVQRWIAPGQFSNSEASAVFSVNSGTALNSASTFDGYTLAQVVRALRSAGLLV